MKSMIRRSVTLLVSALVLNPSLSMASTDAAAVTAAIRRGAAELGVPTGELQEQPSPSTPATAPVFVDSGGADDAGMPAKISAALRAAPRSAKAADVLAAAGYRPGGLSPREVYRAFRAELGDKQLAELAAKWDKQYGPQAPARSGAPTVADLGATSIAGERYACLYDGCIVEGAIAVAFLVALSGCATSNANASLSRGMTYIGLAVSGKDCRSAASKMGYSTYLLRGFLCYADSDDDY